MGDWNTKVEERQVDEEGVMGKEALKCVRNDNGERFVEFCATNSLVITTTSFPHTYIHKYTWTSPDGRPRIDHVAVNSRFKRSVFDTRSYRVVGKESDEYHFFLGALIRRNKAPNAGSQLASTRR